MKVQFTVCLLIFTNGISIFNREIGLFMILKFLDITEMQKKKEKEKYI